MTASESTARGPSSTPAGLYECLLLLDPAQTADRVAAVRRLLAVLERHRAAVAVARPWDERRLAYPVKGRQQGLYVLVSFRFAGTGLAAMELDLRLNDSVLRLLVTRVERKLADVVLAMACQESPAPALSTGVTAQPTTDP